MRRLSLFSAACLALSGLAITPMLGSGTATGSSAHAQAATKGPSGLPLPRFVSLKARDVDLDAFMSPMSPPRPGRSTRPPPSAASGRDVADRQARGAAGEAAVGDQGAGLAQPLRFQVAGRIEHLLHAGAAARAFVADDDHVAGATLPVRMRLTASSWLSKTTRRPGEFQDRFIDAGGFHDAAVSAIAEQDGEAAILREGMLAERMTPFSRSVSSCCSGATG
jgi:hypothetical protein